MSRERSPASGHEPALLSPQERRELRAVIRNGDPHATDCDGTTLVATRVLARLRSISQESARRILLLSSIECDCQVAYPEGADL